MTNILSLVSLRVAAVIGGAALIAGCLPTPTEAAQARFSKGVSCPKDRVKVTPVEGPPPPAELGNDPERIALWRKKNLNPTYLRTEGCGRAVTYECSESSITGDKVNSCFPTVEANQDELVRRATVDMHCPAPSLHVAQKDSGLDLEGCGLHSLYYFDSNKEDWAFMVLIPTPATTPAS
jgi:hypothetical protein